MMEDNAHVNLRKTARIAGALYFIFAFIGVYTFMVIQPKIIVAGDAAATAKNILDLELLFRLSKAAGLLSNFLFVLIVLKLYQLFKQTDEHFARLMVGLVMIAVPIGFVGDAFEISALSIFKSEILHSFQQEQGLSIGMLLMKMSSNIGQMLTLFWGLWLFPLGILVHKSRFIPWIFGSLLIINGLGYVIHSFAFVLFPDHFKTILKFIFPTYFVGEVPFIFWLLIKGVKHR